MREHFRKTLETYSDEAKKKMEVEKKASQIESEDEFFKEYSEKPKSNVRLEMEDNLEVMQKMLTLNRMIKSKKEELDQGGDNVEQVQDEIAQLEDEFNLIQDIQKIETRVSSDIEETAKKRESGELQQEEIFKIQKEKQELMIALKKDLSNIDNLEKQPGERFVTVEKVGGVEKYVNKYKGEKRVLTLGEIMTDGEWGVDYHLDNSIDKSLRKRFIVEKYKRKLSLLLDKQILIDELSSKKTPNADKKGYTAMQEDLYKSEKQLSPGIIAEKLVRVFMNKLKYDSPDLPFDIYKADASDDMWFKCDFVLVRSRINENKNQNVKSLANEESSDVEVKMLTKEDIMKSKANLSTAVQFTTIPENAEDIELKEKIEHKEQQVDRAKKRIKEELVQFGDVVLVSIPINDIKKMYYQWEEEGKKPGGPDKLLAVDKKFEIFKKILAPKFNNREVKQSWSQAKKAIKIQNESLT